MASAAFAKLYCRRTVMSYRYSISGAGTACARGGGASAPLNVTATTRTASDAARRTVDARFVGISVFRNGVPLSRGCAGILSELAPTTRVFSGGERKWTTALADGQRGCPQNAPTP